MEDIIIRVEGTKTRSQGGDGDWRMMRRCLLTSMWEEILDCCKRLWTCGWEELIMVCESYTVLFRVKSEGLVLFRGGNDMVCLDDDGKPLVFYDVIEKSMIWILSLAVKLTIKMPQARDVVTLNAYRVNTVKDIKSYIFEKMGIPFSNQKLFYRGIFLSDEADSLDGYKMEGNCDIFATFGSGDDDEQVPNVE
ncbi:hypothetical protein RchiOBHm_Chr6g0287481 [Rosa chinensis]|uniref:Ubiquitin-like domain-containing protein n=1 Tax=Rosa chinensis TaxID=74649 RepID=A0A2P6PV29_ROSCH|nr:hypothetical protein RchiOBHm_Chr6g0287481 [Rosa chinensis]